MPQRVASPKGPAAASVAILVIAVLLIYAASRSAGNPIVAFFETVAILFFMLLAEFFVWRSMFRAAA